MTQITITGIGNLTALLSDQNLTKALSRSIALSAQTLRDDTKKLPPVSARGTGYGAKGIPVDTGRMRQSIIARQISQFAAGVAAPVHYAKYVHDGTGKVPARPFFQYALEDFGTLKKIEIIFNEQISKAFGG
jgi:hypothetical protein